MSAALLSIAGLAVGLGLCALLVIVVLIALGLIRLDIKVGVKWGDK